MSKRSSTNYLMISRTKSLHGHVEKTLYSTCAQNTKETKTRVSILTVEPTARAQLDHPTWRQVTLWKFFTWAVSIRKSLERLFSQAQKIAMKVFANAKETQFAWTSPKTFWRASKITPCKNSWSWAWGMITSRVLRSKQGSMSPSTSTMACKEKTRCSTANK